MRLTTCSASGDVTSALLHPGTVHTLRSVASSGKPLIGRCHDMCFDFKEVFATKFSISSSRRTTSPSTGVARVPRKAHPDNRHCGREWYTTGHINAVQPVSPRPRQCRNDSGTNSLLERRRSIARSTACGSGRLSNNAVPAGAFPVPVAVVQHFIHQQLPFAIRVSGVTISLASCRKRLMTLSCLVTEVGAVIATFPGQLANPQDSSAIAAVVGVWLRLLKQVTDTPVTT